jgi:hypothetical protein
LILVVVWITFDLVLIFFIPLVAREPNVAKME